MTIKNNQNNTAAAILESNNIGVGKTHHLTELYQLESDNIFRVAGHEPVQLSENLIRAKFIHWFHLEFKNSDKDKILSAFSSDFLTPFHQKQFEKGATATAQVKNTVLSALDYRKNYIRANVSKITFEQTAELLAESENAEGLSKNDLVALVSKFVSLFEKEEEKQIYIEKLEKEEAEKQKFVKLENAGFSNIRTISESVFSADVPLDQATQIADIMNESNFILVLSNINFEEQVISVTFQDKPE